MRFNICSQNIGINKGRLSKEDYALSLAYIASLRSEDPFIKVGSCAVRFDDSIASLGYNGPPAGINIDWSNRDERRKRVIHAESNCLRYCRPGEIKYMAVTLCPCSECLKNITSFGIKKVYYHKDYDKDLFSKELAIEFGVELIKLEDFNFIDNLDRLTI